MTRFRNFALGLALAALFAAPAAPQEKPATVLLIGANGMIGSRILAEAAGRGHPVLAASRQPEKIATGANIRTLKLDATDTASVAAAARQADVVVLATSPRGGGDPLQEEKAVAGSVMAAARAAGKRLVVVGGAGSLSFPDGRPVLDTLPPALRNGESLALRNVLDALKASDLDWTFICPPMSIAPGTRTGRYRTGSSVLLSDAAGASRISAEDFAAALVDELEKPAHRRGQMTAAY